MRTLTINFIPAGQGYENVIVETTDFEEAEILQAIEHALLQLRLHGNKRRLELVK
jgi:hypothetical protein